MKPIGVFDSGVGGLTVVAALRRHLPAESILYLGDTARLPYGTKSPATVARYTRRNVEFLLDRGVKAVVVACNTASAIALDEIRVPVPLWGVIAPGAAEAVEVGGERIGVIATESTIRSDAYARHLHALDASLQVLSQACPLFVPLVEEGWHEDPVTVDIATRYLTPLLEQGIDTLVLGCTHYPLLRPVIEEIVGSGVQLVDSAESVARATAKGLADSDLLNGDLLNGRRSRGEREPEDHFCVTDAALRFDRIARSVLGNQSVSLELVEVV